MLFQLLARHVGSAKTEFGENYPHKIAFLNRTGRKNATKRLAAIAKLAFEVIPQDPARAEYRQGSTLGEDHKHWFRAKFFQQYRLFFRYHAKSKVIVFAWVNDEDTKRAYESGDDAYRVFRKMLESGHPPDDWQQLLTQATESSNRLQKVSSQVSR